jgi:hypothetical protein
VDDADAADHQSLHERPEGVDRVVRERRHVLGVGC